MKKSLLSVAVLSLWSGVAAGQSAVNIYGIVDAGLVHERGGAAGSVTRVSSGVANASRIGFRGTEELGNGVSAFFVLETGTKIDTGELDVAGSIFNRQAFVGIKSSAGALTLGRQYTPYYTTVSTVADPFAAGLSGSAKNLLPTAGANTRSSNTVLYTSPQLGGVSGELAYSLGERAGDGSGGRQFGAALAYASGPLSARIGYNNKDSSNAAVAGAPKVIGRNTLLAVNYKFLVAKTFLAYGINKGVNSAPLPNAGTPYSGPRATASSDSRDLLLGVAVPFGANTLLASYIRKDDRTGFNQDADQWAVGYTHALSKRTLAYTSYGKISNDNGAGYTVGNNTDAGSGDSAFNVGVRHTF
ncbi:MAG TPA: porin [Telluria sp.]